LPLDLDSSLEEYFLPSFFLFIARKNLFASVLVFIAFIIPVCYTGVGFEFGKINMGYVGSLIETNVRESKEFLLSLPLKNYILVALLFVLLSVILFFYRNSHQIREKWRLKKVALFILILAILFPTTQLYKFYVSSIYSYTTYYAEHNKLLYPVKNEDFVFRKRQDAMDKDVRVVIIGESERKDHLSLYGYPHNTTLFLNDANGTFVDGYVSAAPNTITSLVRTLVYTDSDKRDIDLSYSVIGLANNVGYATYWISVQGFVGVHDTTTTLIASASDNVVFLNNRGG
jgi:glucan phosphoethanolaminetransferase (alkaline phosphatase superfamily)